MSRKYLFHTLIVAVLATTTTINAYGEVGSFRDVMRGMVNNMKTIVEGIMEENYKKVSEAAADIAYHPEPPPEQRFAIINELKMELATFKIYDDNMRRKATALGEAADAKDQKAVLENYAELAKACMTCHNSYRSRIRRLKSF